MVWCVGDGLGWDGGMGAGWGRIMWKRGEKEKNVLGGVIGLVGLGGFI